MVGWLVLGCGVLRVVGMELVCGASWELQDAEYVYGGRDAGVEGFLGGGEVVRVEFIFGVRYMCVRWGQGEGGRGAQGVLEDYEHVFWRLRERISGAVKVCY